MKSKLEYKRIIGKLYIFYGLFLILGLLLSIIITLIFKPSFSLFDSIIIIIVYIFQIFFIYYLLNKGKRLRKIKNEKQNEFMKAFIYMISLYNIINFIFSILIVIYNYKMSKAK